jgi:hypothetical protein
MASPRKAGDERTVSRTYRAAIRIGEDFVTLEETITLPIDASDDEVAMAIDLGWRIFRAQREAADLQVADIREHVIAPPSITIRDPDAPASDKQRQFIGTLQEQLGWTSEQLGVYAGEQRIDLVTLSKGQASTFIDGLKKLAEERTSYGDGARSRSDTARHEPAPARDSGLANDKQLAALDRLARQHGMDLAHESRQRFGVSPHELTFDQASALLRELQRPPQSRRALGEPAL